MRSFEPYVDSVLSSSYGMTIMFRWLIRPAMVAMVDHLLQHAPVDPYIFACNKSTFFTAQKEYEIKDILCLADSVNQMLKAI